MKFEIKTTLLNGKVKSFITKEYESYNPEKKKVATFRQIVIKDGKDYIRAIKPEFESLEYALAETFRHSDKVGVMSRVDKFF